MGRFTALLPAYPGLSRAGSGLRRKNQVPEPKVFDHSAWSECGETRSSGKVDESRACFFLAAGQLETGGRRLSTNKSASSSSSSSGKEILSPKRLKAEAESRSSSRRNKFFSHHHKPPLRFSPLHMFSLIIFFDLDPIIHSEKECPSNSKQKAEVRTRARHVSTRLTVSCLPAFSQPHVLDQNSYLSSDLFISSARARFHP
jgi:hypothetical protein